MELSEPAPSSLCGECTLCCKVLPFERHSEDEHTMGGQHGDKQEGKWCTRCTHSAKPDEPLGCSIFHSGNRPRACEKFECGWLMSQGHDYPMPAEMRPDRTQMVLVIEQKSANAPDGRFVLHVNPSALASKPWRKNPMRSAVQKWDDAGIQVFVKCGSYQAALSAEAIKSLKLGTRNLDPKLR